MKRKLHMCYPTLLAALLVLGCGKKEDPAAGGPPEGMAAIAVIAEASRETVANTIELVGTLEARNEINVSSEINGNVQEILFDEGASVKAGQTLLRIDDRKIAARKAEAKSRLDLAKATFKRSESLFQSETISEQEFDNAKAEHDVAEATYDLLKEELKDTVINAPFEGIVGERLISPGQNITSGQALTRLVQMNPLEAVFRVPEIHLSKVAKGQTVRLNAAAFPGREIKGVVYFIDPFVEKSARTVMVKASVENNDATLKPGVFGSIELELSVNDNAVVIPEAAVRYSGDQASVVVRNEKGLADFRNVTVGTRTSDRVEITSGLTAGEQVVVEGFQKIFFPGMPIMISPDSVRYGVEPEPPAGAPPEMNQEAPAEENAE